MDQLDKSYWTNRYANNEIPWDIGTVSTPIKTYIDQLKNKNLKILIPGCGNAHEAIYIWNQGFKNLHVLDISEWPLNRLKQQIPDMPSTQFICEDYFDHHGTYDLILEQTFFCALEPSQRLEYVNHTSNLLSTGSKLVGLFFDFPLTSEGPPYGGDEALYKELFSARFDIEIMERAYNSIKPRTGHELFIKMIRKENL